MFVLFNRFQRLSKPASIPFSFPYLFCSRNFSFLLFLFPLKSQRIFTPHRGKPIRIRKIQFCVGISFFLFLISFLSCEKSTAPVNNPQVTLTAEYVGVTEAELLLQTKNTEVNTQYQLFRDDSLISDGNLLQSDTKITDSLLFPAHSYTYKGQLIKDGNPIAYSQPLQITTMDTTSHDFQWELIEFPSLYGSSGVLRDVAIINENDVWCVGEIYADSAQPWLPYNAVHWDGEQWELKRIKTNACGGVDYPPINAIFAFSFNDVLFAHTDGSITHYDGRNFINDCSLITQLNSSANKMWGTSRNDLYVVSGNGLIAYYNDSSWQKLESWTDLGLLDIWGISQTEIYTVGLNYGQALGVVLKYDGIAWQKMIEGFVEGNGFDPSQLFKTQLYGLTDGIWVDEHRTLYTVGNLMYQYKRGKWDYVRSLPENYVNGNPGNYYRGYLHAVRGSASNDIFIFGQSETLIHFNGSTWQKVGPAYVPWSPRWWYNCDVKEDLIVGVGRDENCPRIIKLWR